MHKIGTRSQRSIAREKLASKGIHSFDQLIKAVRRGHGERGEILEDAPLVFPDRLAAIQDLTRGIRPQVR